jgi:hypothetical protein
MAVWRRPTWYHLISITDFVLAVEQACRSPRSSGIYLLGDERPMLLQELLDTMAVRWGFAGHSCLPEWMFTAAAGAVEGFALASHAVPDPPHLMRIGMVSHVCDTARMKPICCPAALPDIGRRLGVVRSTQGTLSLSKGAVG